MQKQLTQLKVDNINFLVQSLIERCPRPMMLRELVHNAIEAAELTESGAGQVRIGATRIGGARKLTIWNAGPGMSAEELRQMSDIAASLRKRMALNENFGMGAKVAGLASN